MGRGKGSGRVWGCGVGSSQVWVAGLSSRRLGSLLCCPVLCAASLCPTWRIFYRGLSVITPPSVPISQASGDTFERPFHNDTCPFCCLCDGFLSGPGHTPSLGPARERTCQHPQVGVCGFWLLVLFPLKMGTSLLFSDMHISNTTDRVSARK